MERGDFVIWPVSERLPTNSGPVFVIHRDGIDRATLCGYVWRLADAGKDQLYDVTHWCKLPDFAIDKKDERRPPLAA